MIALLSLLLLQPAGDLGSRTAGRQAPLPVESKLERCKRQFEHRPELYDSARCFLTIASSVPAPKIRATLETLIASHADPLYLELAQVYFSPQTRQPNPRRAKIIELLERAEARQDHEIAVVMLAHLLHLAITQQRKNELQGWIDRIRSYADSSKQIIARTHASALLAEYQNRRQEDLGEVLASLTIPDESEAKLPYSVRRTLLRNRANANRSLSYYTRAQQDFAALETIAHAQQDSSTIPQAALGKALVMVDRLAEHNNSIEQSTAIDALKHAARSANQLGYPGLEAHALASVIPLLMGAGAPTAEIHKLSTACFFAASQSGDDALLGLCHIACSHFDDRPDSDISLLHALRGLELTEQSSFALARISALQRVAQLLWPTLDQDYALAVTLIILESIEDIRESERSLHFRTRSFARLTGTYEWLLATLLENTSSTSDHLELTLQLSERIRGRSLLDALSDEADNNRRTGAKTVESHARSLVIDFLRAKLFPSCTDKSTNDDSKTIPTLEASKQFALASFESTLLDSHQHATIHEIQEALLESEVLVSFQISPNQDLFGHRLPGAKALFISRSDAVWVDLPTEQKELNRLVKLQRKAVRSDTASIDIINARLQKLLLSPIARHIEAGIEDIVFVLDKPLHGMSLHSVFPNHSVVRAPSATHWLRQRQTPMVLANAKPLVVVDPRLGKRARPDLASPTPSNLPTLRGQPSLRPPLKHARAEAAHIQKYYANSALVLKDDAATLSNLRSHWTTKRHLLHIASHSAIDEQTSERSYIALAPEHRDGAESRLDTEQIAKMDFRQALVVLGGCSTASGKYMDGEGTLSLATRFIHSGARAVVATLWPVRDDEASEFFDLFYECLGRGAALSTCLTRARQKARETGISAATYDSFTILGDGRLTLKGPVRFPHGLVFLAFIVVSLLGWRFVVRLGKQGAVPRASNQTTTRFSSLVQMAGSTSPTPEPNLDC